MLIYKATNLINGKAYIGQTTRKPQTRLNEHLSKGTLLGRAIAEYGRRNFKVEMIDHAHTKTELNQKEIFWISYHNTIFPNGYNISTGGAGYSGCGIGEKNYFYGKRGELAANSVKVVCVETGVVYPSAKAAADAVGADRSCIIKCCKHKIKKCKQYHWEYYKKGL